MARRKRGRSTAVKLLQFLLLVAVIVAGVRLYFILRERMRPPAAKAKPASRPLNREAYVVPRKLHAYDLASARELTRLPSVWVQEGYRYVYYPYDPATRRTDFAHEAGLLGPIEELHINNVVAQPTSKPNYHQIVAIFEKSGRSFAVPVGTESGGSFQIYADEIFYYEDPRQLYAFWPASTWEAIANHEVQPGMNEIQADFAVGMGTPQPEQTDPEEKVVKYPNGGHALTVTYHRGRAVKIAK